MNREMNRAVLDTILYADILTAMESLIQLIKTDIAEGDKDLARMHVTDLIIEAEDLAKVLG